MKHPKTEAEERLGLSVFVLFLALAALLLGLWFGLYRSRHSFTREKWLRAPDRRAKLVEDLFHDHELVGMTEAEVLALLGEPDDSGYLAAEGRLVYPLGSARSVIESEWLLLEFSEGRVERYRLTSDLEKP